MPRTQRSTPLFRGVVGCRAGAVTKAASATVPVLRSGMKNAAARPGHGYFTRAISSIAPAGARTLPS
ncbi:MAG: hypothetical protein QOH32_3028, partial [Bradyrhizobium sp.]|nr:hypothetical protein [Bradyrhizobium sp.]